MFSVVWELSFCLCFIRGFVHGDVSRVVSSHFKVTSFALRSIAFDDRYQDTHLDVTLELSPETKFTPRIFTHLLFVFSMSDFSLVLYLFFH